MFMRAYFMRAHLIYARLAIFGTYARLATCAYVRALRVKFHLFYEENPYEALCTLVQARIEHYERE